MVRGRGWVDGLAQLDADAGVEAIVVGLVMPLGRSLDRDGAGQRRRGGGEGDECSVALAQELASPMRRDRVVQTRQVGCVGALDAALAEPRHDGVRLGQIDDHQTRESRRAPTGDGARTRRPGIRLIRVSCGAAAGSSVPPRMAGRRFASLAVGGTLLKAFRPTIDTSTRPAEGAAG